MFYRFLKNTILITLLGCMPYIKTENQPFLPKTIEHEQVECFEILLHQVRTQTEQISFCLQQLAQTIQAGKLSCPKDKAITVIENINEIQAFTKYMLDSILTQPDPQIIIQGFILNNALIHYLLPVMKKNPLLINTQDLEKALETSQKKSIESLDPKSLDKIMQENDSMIEELIKKTDFVGLTWYNNMYRNFKKYNGYYLVKGATLTAAGCLILSIIASSMVNELPLSITNKNWFKNYIGQRYDYDGAGNKWLYLLADENVSNACLPSSTQSHQDFAKIFAEGKDGKPIEILKQIPLSFKSLPKIQNIALGIESLSRRGYISVASLLAINYKDIFSNMYGSTWEWIKGKAYTKAKKLEDALQGTAKQALDNSKYEKIYFKDLTGVEYLEELAKKIANFMKHPERYERSEIEEHRGILLYGPPQTGKTLFAKALRTYVQQEVAGDKKIEFIDAKAIYENNPQVNIKDLFELAQYLAPCILFFDELDLFGANREKNTWTTAQFLTCMQGIDMVSKQVIVIGATNRPAALDAALLVDGRFGKKIPVEAPKYEHRKAFLQKELIKRSIMLNPVFIDHIAQETEGCTYNNLKRIVTEAIILSSIEVRPVCELDFEKSLDSEIRQIQPAYNLSESDKELIATYQAGKAVIRQLFKTKKEVVKITIHNVAKDIKSNEFGFAIKTNNSDMAENDQLATMKKEIKVKLGEVFTKSNITYQELLSDTDIEYEIYALLAGNIALKLQLNKTFTQCNPHDRAEALKLIYSIISYGEKITPEIQKQALVMKEEFETIIMNALQDNKEFLQETINVLKQQCTISRDEWKTLVKRFAR